MPRPKLALPKRFAFTTELTVRVSDVNYAGHLSNDRLLAFVHEARARFLKAHGFTELDVEGRGSIMTDAVLLYKSEAFHGDTLRIQVGIDELHRYRCSFFFRITQKTSGKEVARARTGLVFFDYRAKKMVDVPPGFRRIVEQHAGGRR